MELKEALEEERSFSDRLLEGIDRVLDMLERHLPKQLLDLVDKARDLLPEHQSYRGDQQHAEQGCTHPVPAAVREEWLHQIQQETQDTAKADDRVPDGQERRCAGRPPDGGQAGA